MNESDLVFIGGGHTHVLVLRMLAMKPIPNVRLTLISDTRLTPYSGMLPGFISGHYSKAQTHIDLNKLAQAANVRFIHGRVTGLDVDLKRIHIHNHPDIEYDKVSINVGSTPNLTVPGAKEFAVGVKPVSQLTATWAHLLAHDYQGKTPHWAVVGAGAAGVEIALAIAHRFAQQQKPIQLSLVQSGSELLSNYQRGVQKAVLKALKRNNVTLVNHFRVAKVEQQQLVADDNQVLAIDKSIWCTPATAPTWPKKAGLATDELGFIEVNEYLQSTSHPDVFAAGDVASMTYSPRPKAGVYAVRSAPFLEKNLRAALQHTKFTKTKLQTSFLSLISLGNRTATGQKMGFSFSGGWVWKWKGHIDLTFMDLFQKHLPYMHNDMEEPMQCAGCGSKLGPQMLQESLKDLPIYKQDNFPHHLVKTEDAAVAIVNKEQSVYQSIDGFRAFTDDLYRLGIVTTHHAVNDLYAMGIQPTSAQVWANICFAHPRLSKRDFQQLMSGITEALIHHETTLVGGHSTQGKETHLAMVVNGQQHHIWPKNNLKAGDYLLLNRPLGSGVILAADMQRKAEAEIVDGLWAHLLTSNRNFFTAVQNHEVHSATDVSGFGLIGHCLEMVEGSDLQINIDSRNVPLLPGVLDLSQVGIASSLLPQLLPLKNRCMVSENAQSQIIDLLLDPQTNGGLLVSVSPEVAEQLLVIDGVVKVGHVTCRMQTGDKEIAIY
ncbi:selenide, water dikinase SelD [Paraglaciecola sp. 20A4]|uniref:selenide, water dikinase SelD n=1 Tax=Paraglaciecola sp. 20A4 TaxID=2687288 RepID=UPI00140AD471|nr:selenide, water dikinase SelD [Paraglaciecola sp. 20A4]